MSNSIRTTPVRGKKSSGKTNFLPEKISLFLTSRSVDVLGLFLCILGLLFAASLVSYHPADPSLNSANSEGAVYNLLGRSGAYTADLFLQCFGVVSLVFPAMFIMSGWRILMRQLLPKGWTRVTAFLLGVIGATIGFASIPSFPGWLMDLHLGGSVGVVLLNMITSTIQAFGFFVIFPIISAVSFMVAFFALNYATGLTVHHWMYAIYRSSKTVYGALSFVGQRISHAVHVMFKRDAEFRKQNLKVATPKTKAPAKKKDVPVVDEPDTIESVLRAPPVVNERKATKIAKGKRANKEKQPSLSLGTDDAQDWQLPTLDMLDEPPVNTNPEYSPEALQRNAELLQNVLNDFGVEGQIVAVNPGPIITLYELEPAPGTKSSRVINLADDIARSMSTTTVRVAVIPGKNAIGIELPNSKRETVFLKDLLESREYENTSAKLPLVLGKNIGGEPIIADLARMPHLLVAGTTGSGKSVAVNTMILSLLYQLSPEKCRLIMIDPKMLELSVYDDIPHLLTSVVTEPHKAVTALKWAVGEMEDRYRSMSKLGVRNIEGYNKRIIEARDKGEVLMNRVQTGFDHETGKPVFEEQPIPLIELPYIVVVVDEFADLMLVAGKEVEGCIQRLAQMARAAGIHLIMATQRPSVDVITGVIKANFPTRISFQVTSKIDSRTILGEAGAEQLLGRGDMLFMPSGEKIVRVHGPFVDDPEVEHVVTFLKEQGEPDYIDNVTIGEDGDEMFKGIAAGNSDYDELYDDAVALILREKKASTSFVQRHLQIGYNRAARIIEQMEKDGVIGPANHVGKREILIEDHTGQFE